MISLKVESLCEEYKTTVLATEAFVKELSEESQKRLRHIDCIVMDETSKMPYDAHKEMMGPKSMKIFCLDVIEQVDADKELLNHEEIKEMPETDRRIGMFIPKTGI
jgi:hypothetical protein